MAPWSISSEAYLKGFCVFSIIYVLSILCLVLIQRFYPEATSVVAAAITIDDRVARAFAAHSFFTALYYICSLLNCARKRLTNASLATDTEQTLLNTPGAVRTTMWCLLCHTYVFAHQWMTADIVSLKRPLLQNFKAALMYTLRGLNVLFVAFLIFVFVRWLKEGSPDVAAQAPPPPVQVLDDGAATKEKEYVEAKN
jgi:Zn-dependent protease